jgi:hypothetical protein
VVLTTSAKKKKYRMQWIHKNLGQEFQCILHININYWTEGSPRYRVFLWQLTVAELKKFLSHSRNFTTEPYPKLPEYSSSPILWDSFFPLTKANQNVVWTAHTPVHAHVPCTTPTILRNKLNGSKCFLLEVINFCYSQFIIAYCTSIHITNL